MAGAGAAHADPYAARLADSSIGVHTMTFLQSVPGVNDGFPTSRTDDVMLLQM
jgi:hypothetical protein